MSEAKLILAMLMKRFSLGYVAHDLVRETAITRESDPRMGSGCVYGRVWLCDVLITTQRISFHGFIFQWSNLGHARSTT